MVREHSMKKTMTAGALKKLLACVPDDAGVQIVYSEADGLSHHQNDFDVTTTVGYSEESYGGIRGASVTFHLKVYRKWRKYAELLDRVDRTTVFELILRERDYGHREILCIPVKIPSGEYYAGDPGKMILLRAVLDVLRDDGDDKLEGE